ncbi:hypothetical protein [Cellulomonas xiejunii]|nr:hypothetical protein [Cellulomonas xiejunii]
MSRRSGDDIAEQTREAIRRIEAALEQVGAAWATWYAPPCS